MTDWKQVHSSADQQPSELDTTSSPTTVYERKNIRQETVIDPQDQSEYSEWVYDEREMTKEEYENLNSPTTQFIMQSLSDIEVELLALTI